MSSFKRACRLCSADKVAVDIAVAIRRDNLAGRYDLSAPLYKDFFARTKEIGVKLPNSGYDCYLLAHVLTRKPE